MAGLIGLTPQVTDYNLNRRMCTWGAIEIDGLDGPIQIKQAPIYGHKTGRDGKTCRFRLLEQTFMITIPLQWSSATNDQLSAASQLAYNHAVTGLEDSAPFVYVDGTGRTNLIIEHCWIENVPDLSIDAEPAPREWQLAGVGLVARFDGGC